MRKLLLLSVLVLSTLWSLAQQKNSVSTNIDPQIRIKPAHHSEKNISKDSLLLNAPQYVNTGDAVKDTQEYNRRKQDWIVQNPEKYELILRQNKSNTIQPKKK